MYYLAVDIGGTAIKLGLVTEKGRVEQSRTYPADFDAYQTPLQETALKSAADFLTSLAPEGTGAVRQPRQLVQDLGIQGVGISATCLIDMGKGRVAGAHFPHYEGAELKKRFEEIFGIECRVVNDANSAALAELWSGALKGCRNGILLTLGTGIGAGIIVNGQLLEGSHGFAGEAGHISIKKDGPPASYGNRGGFEEYASTRALLERVRERLLAAGRPLPAAGVSGHWFFENVTGDELLTSVLDAWMEDLVVGLENLVYIFDPEVIVIGGGISRQETRLIAPLEKRLKEKLMHAYREDIRLVAATHGNDAGLIGAVYLFVA